MKANSKLYLTLFLLNTLAITLMLVLRHFFSETLEDVSIEAWGIFFAVVGAIYAIIAGFLLVELLSRFHRLSATLQDELNAIEDIRDFLVYIDDNENVKYNIRQALLNYIDSVIGREWSILVSRPKEGDSDTSPELYKIMEAVEDIQVIDQSDSVALDAIITKISDVTSFRTERFERSKQQLSPALRGLIVFMSTMIVIGFVLMYLSSVWIHSFMIFAVVTSIYLLYFVIRDVNQPYTGLWNVTNKPFLKVRERLINSLK